jgi:hypothetical protein
MGRHTSFFNAVDVSFEGRFNSVNLLGGKKVFDYHETTFVKFP